MDSRTSFDHRASNLKNIGGASTKINFVSDFYVHSTVYEE